MTITKYKGIEAAVPVFPVTEDDINGEIQQLLESRPVRVSKEGPVANGDTCAIDYKGCKDGIPFEGGTGSYNLVIGSGSFIPGFEEKMIGMAKGETRDIELTFPEQYHAAELAGAEVVFTVTVHDIFSENPAELNDEFVAGLHAKGINTVDDLKKYVSSRMKQNAQLKSMEMAEEAVMTALIDNADAVPDPDRVNAAIDHQIRQVEINMQSQGVTLEQYLQMTGMSMEVIRDQLREDAEKQVKLEAVLKEIAALEALEVTEEALENHFNDLANNYRVSVEDVKAQISNEAASSNLLCRLAHELVMNNALITYVEQ